MNVKEITDNIYYVGVNDRTLTLFEGLWPLPYGVTYNSYVVKGEKSVALIDTVNIDEVREFINNIRSLKLNVNIDYLVVNHMEPDHSGSIAEILRMYPDIKIVGNVKTVEMIKGFYHITDDSAFKVIKEGDKIDLGGKTLQFSLIPMVHWPETMVTYVPEDKLLFSGDAFGTFGALNGGVVDYEMDTDVYIKEMYRYYSNIVGKYGVPVQRALSKLKDIPVSYICPTHGPVWKERIGDVMRIVDNLSAYRSEEGAVIVYGSMYGNTAEVAETIASELSGRGIKPIKVYNASTAPMSNIISDAFRYKILAVGSATYSMRLFPPVETFMNAMETREIKNKDFGIFGSYTWAKDIVLTRLEEYAKRMKLPVKASLCFQHSSNDGTSAEVKKFVDKLL